MWVVHTVKTVLVSHCVFRWSRHVHVLCICLLLALHKIYKFILYQRMYVYVWWYFFSFLCSLREKNWISKRKKRNTDDVEDIALIARKKKFISHAPRWLPSSGWIVLSLTNSISFSCWLIEQQKWSLIECAQNRFSLPSQSCRDHPDISSLFFSDILFKNYLI